MTLLWPYVMTSALYNMASLPLVIKQKHNKLLVDLCELIYIDAPSYKNFIGFLHNADLPGGRLQQVKKEPIEVFHLMEEKGILKAGDYTALEQALDASGNMQGLYLVQNVGSEIKILIKEPGSTKIVTERTRAMGRRSSSKQKATIATQGTSAAGDGSSSGKKELIATPGTSAASHGSSFSKKRKIATQGASVSGAGSPSEHTDVGESSKDVYEVYDRKDKKGFLLILNFTESRDGTEHDVSKLTNFFDKTLRFEVQDPRKDRDTDLSLSELNKVLQNARCRLNERSREYFCFFCAVLSHGNKKGILCSDRKRKPIDEIMKTFTNDKMENFAGKPKVFLIQACRGDDAQKGYDVADDWPADISDVAGKMTVPTDADVLIAYATTPGNLAFRRPTIGSWFIQVTINVFEERHKDDHVEEMFIKVRNEIAKDEKWRTRNNELMMPCTWSTLTQKLMI